MTRPMVYAALAALAFSAPAAAEPLRLAQQQRAFEPGAVPPYEVLTIVRSAGLDPLGQPFRRGPNYVLRAIGSDDQEVRVIVSARTGDILRVVPIATASRMPPGGVTMGPYERMDGAPPDYVAPAPRGTVAAPHDVDEDGYPPEADAPRPPEGVPSAGLPGAPPQRGSDISRQELPPPSEPRVITATESPMPGERSDGLLPPPPERFPQRAAPPTVKLKPIKRAAAAPPKQAPLPKPRPAIAAAPNPSAAPAAAPPAIKPDASDALPN